MSLLDGRHVVSVETATLTENAYHGSDVVYGPKRSVRCNVHPLRADEASDLGVTVDSAVSVTARSWPGGPYSRVTYLGRQWFQRGETQRSRMGVATRHDRALLTSTLGQVA